MIVRNNKVNPNSENVKFGVSYGFADVKRFLSLYIDKLTMSDPDLMMAAKSVTVSEQDVRHYLESSPTVFYWVEKPYRQMLSAWAFRQMVNKNLLLPSSIKEDGFVFADEAFVRRGRPKENV